MSSRAADGSRRVLEETMAPTRVAEKPPVPLGQWQLQRRLHPVEPQEKKEQYFLLLK